jgi:hypothetical protein
VSDKYFTTLQVSLYCSTWLLISFYLRYSRRGEDNNTADILQAITQSRANNLSHLLDGLGINLQSPPSRALTQPVTHIMHPSHLCDFQRFLKNNSASFKDPQQALVLELISWKRAFPICDRANRYDIFPYKFCIAVINTLDKVIQK